MDHTERDNPLIYQCHQWLSSTYSMDCHPFSGSFTVSPRCRKLPANWLVTKNTFPIALELMLTYCIAKLLEHVEHSRYSQQCHVHKLLAFSSKQGNVQVLPLSPSGVFYRSISLGENRKKCARASRWTYRGKTITW